MKKLILYIFLFLVLANVIFAEDTKVIISSYTVINSPAAASGDLGSDGTRYFINAINLTAPSTFTPQLLTLNISSVVNPTEVNITFVTDNNGFPSDTLLAGFGTQLFNETVFPSIGEVNLTLNATAQIPVGTKYHIKLTSNTVTSETKRYQLLNDAASSPQRDSRFLSDSPPFVAFNNFYFVLWSNDTGDGVTTDSARIAPDPALDSDDLQGFGKGTLATTTDQKNLSFDWEWTKNGVQLINGTTGNISNSTEVLVNTLDSSNTVANDSFTFKVRAILNDTVQGDFVTSSQVNITAGIIDNCSTFTTHAINFTIKDELNQSNVTADITGTFNFTTDGIKFKQFSLAQTNRDYFSICINPSFASITTDYSIFVENEEYPQRRFTITGAILTNATETKDIFMLQLLQGIFARFKTVDQFDNIITNALGEMRRTISSVSTLIESDLTDSAGLVTFFVDPDSNYDFTFSKTGFTTNTFTIRPTTTEIFSVVLQSQATATNNSFGTGLSYQFNPRNIPLQNNTNFNFTFTVNSGSRTLTGCSLFITDENSTILGSTIGILSGSICNLTIEQGTGNLTQLNAIGEYVFGADRFNVSQSYFVKNTVSGEFSLKNFLDDIRNFGGAGFSRFTLVMFSFLAIAIITGIAAEFGGLTNPESLILLVVGLTVFFCSIGWIPLPEPINGFPILPNHIEQFGVAYLMAMFGAGYIIWRHS